MPKTFKFHAFALRASTAATAAIVAIAAAPLWGCAAFAAQPAQPVLANAEPFGGAPIQGKVAPPVSLRVGIPSKIVSNSGQHAYRAGYERAVLLRTCVRPTQCKIVELDADPRAPGNEPSDQIPEGLDVLLWGGDVRLGSKAESASLAANLDEFYESGEVRKFRTQYMRWQERWPRPLVVGADPGNASRARAVCQSIKAQCTFVINKDFDALDRQFKAGKMNLIIGQSWVFESKDLEDRITLTMD